MLATNLINGECGKSLVTRMRRISAIDYVNNLTTFQRFFHTVLSFLLQVIKLDILPRLKIGWISCACWKETQYFYVEFILTNLGTVYGRVDTMSSECTVCNRNLLVKGIGQPMACVRSVLHSQYIITSISFISCHSRPCSQVVQAGNAVLPRLALGFIRAITPLSPGA